MLFCDNCRLAIENAFPNQRFCSSLCRKTHAKLAKSLVATIRPALSAVSAVPTVTPAVESESSEDEGPQALLIPQNSTRASLALAAISAGRLEELMSTGPRYAQSTLRKHTWVIKLYESFTSAFDVEPFPLNAVVASGFVRFLGLEAKYAVGSIEDVIVPSLKRLHVERCDSEVESEVHQHLARAIRDVKNSRHHVSDGQGKEPLIVPDVKRLIESTPEGLPTKAAESSLWLFALSTGARGVTCENIQLKEPWRTSIRFLISGRG